MKDQWRRELRRLLVTAAASSALGLALGRPFVAISAGLALYIAWHLYQGYKHLRWLRSGTPAASPPTGAGGLWGEIQHRVARHFAALAERDAALRDQMDRYRQVARALPDAAITFDRRGEIDLINHAAGKLLGLREPDDLGRPVRNLIRLPQFVDYIDRGRFEAPLEITSPADPDITLSITIVPYGERDKYLLLARDTSRLHRLERVRQDFIANVSHEMKSPLTVIKGYVENLLDDPAAVKKWGKSLTQIDQQTDRMCSIVEDLLALSNLESGPTPESLQPVDVPALVRSVIAEAEELSQGRHRIQSEIDESLHLLGNFNELYSAVSNVVFNAVSYTDEGGTVSIGWRRRTDGRPRLSVADSGIGIAPEHIPRLTERFYRVDQARSRDLGGTGLGLAIVKHILARHNGGLEVDSEPGKGSTFAFVFPAELVRLRNGSRNGARSSAA